MEDIQVQKERVVLASSGVTGQRRSHLQQFLEIVIVLILAGLGYLGYRFYVQRLQASRVTPVNTASRLDKPKAKPEHERVRRSQPASRPDVPENTERAVAPPVGTANGFQITSASEVPAITNPVAVDQKPHFAPRRTAVPPVSGAGASSGTANAAAETRAIPFTVRESTALATVGGFTIQLKSLDSKSNLYSVRVCKLTRCSDIDQKHLDDVVTLPADLQAGSTQLLATRISHNQLSGMLLTSAAPADVPQK